MNRLHAVSGADGGYVQDGYWHLTLLKRVIHMEDAGTSEPQKGGSRNW